MKSGKRKEKRTQNTTVRSLEQMQRGRRGGQNVVVPSPLKVPLRAPSLRNNNNNNTAAEAPPSARGESAWRWIPRDGGHELKLYTWPRSCPPTARPRRATWPRHVEMNTCKTKLKPRSMRELPLHRGERRPRPGRAAPSSLFAAEAVSTRSIAEYWALHSVYWKVASRCVWDTPPAASYQKPTPVMLEMVFFWTLGNKDFSRHLDFYVTTPASMS